MRSSKNIIAPPTREIKDSVSQGDCVYLDNKKELFQVIGIDNAYEKCWVREWPLNPQGSPVFEIPIKQICHNQIKN